MTSQRSTLREYLEALLIAGIFLGFANTFVIKTFYIPSASMEETLLIGDHLFVNRFVFRPAPTAAERALLPLRPVRRGDIVIFRSPERPAIDMVKRCVGLPGDVVEIAQKQLFVNGEAVDDSSYAIHRDTQTFGSPGSGAPADPSDIDRCRARTASPANQRIRDNFGPCQVPDGHFFCMGDNRDQSYDSRFWGPVPAHFIKGRAFMVYWSYGGEVSDGSWHGWGHKLRQLAGTAVGFFTRSRWSRTFDLVQ
jgi:signal peptidase I